MRPLIHVKRAYARGGRQRIVGGQRQQEWIAQACPALPKCRCSAKAARYLNCFKGIMPIR